MENISKNRRIARIAGILYLILGIGAGYSWMFISKIYVNGNVLLTLNLEFLSQANKVC
jgi:hypothetical protein